MGVGAGVGAGVEAGVEAGVGRLSFYIKNKFLYKKGWGARPLQKQLF
jgi:hypothetical protein